MKSIEDLKPYLVSKEDYIFIEDAQEMDYISIIDQILPPSYLVRNPSKDIKDLEVIDYNITNIINFVRKNYQLVYIHLYTVLGAEKTISDDNISSERYNRHIEEMIEILKFLHKVIITYKKLQEERRDI